MHLRRLALVVSCLLLAFVAGCGTLVNFEKGALDNPKIYGGVQFDAEMVRTINTGDEHLVKVLSLLYAVDMPFSLLADTVTLPITLTTTLINYAKDDRK